MYEGGPWGAKVAPQSKTENFMQYENVPEEQIPRYGNLYEECHMDLCRSIVDSKTNIKDNFCSPDIIESRFRTTKKEISK
jgi:hypothetical protein